MRAQKRENSRSKEKIHVVPLFHESDEDDEEAEEAGKRTFRHVSCAERKEKVCLYLLRALSFSVQPQKKVFLSPCQPPTSTSYGTQKEEKLLLIYSQRASDGGVLNTKALFLPLTLFAPLSDIRL